VGRAVQDVLVTSCFAMGNVTGNDSDIGGLFGELDRATVENSYAIGAVSGVVFVGGLAGQAVQNTLVTSCYAKGDVTASNNNAGGLIGSAISQTTIIRDSFATNGTITYTGSSSSSTFHRVIGSVSIEPQLTNLYANKDMERVASNRGTILGNVTPDASGLDGESKSIEDQFQSTDFFSDTSWTNDDSWSTDVWTFSDDDYPHLKWED
jgi:hypothetical protein